MLKHSRKIKIVALFIFNISLSNAQLNDVTIDLNEIDGSDGFIIDMRFSGATSKYSIGSAGDLNADGKDDIMIGNFNQFSLIRGVVFVVNGTDGGFQQQFPILDYIDGTTGYLLSGYEMYAGFGYSLSSIGDVNNDGFDDVMIGSIKSDTELGSSNYVLYGPITEFNLDHREQMVVDASGNNMFNGENGFEIKKNTGSGCNDILGFKVSRAGDFNGDGIDDMLFGGALSGCSDSDNGSAYVLFGDANGFSTPFNVASLDGSNGFQIMGDHENFANAISLAGDVNADGFDDLLIARGSLDNATFVIYGKSSLLPANIDIASMDDSIGVKINAGGADVSYIGDINNDGIDDFMFSNAIGLSPSAQVTGAAYIVFGTAQRLQANFDVTSLNGTNGFAVYGESDGDQLGINISSAGDLNADGFDDIVIGSPKSDVYGVNSGIIHVIFGKKTFPPFVDLSKPLDSKDGFKIKGGGDHDEIGRFLTEAGDINADGIGDLLIGVPLADKAFILYGDDQIFRNGFE